MSDYKSDIALRTTPAVSCDRRGRDNVCPISKKICPGVCIYEQILANIMVGILVFDILKKEVVFSNHEADRILDDLCPTKDFDALHARLFPDLDAMRRTPEPPARSIKHGHRVYGFTGYFINSDYLWLFVKDVTEKERLLAVAEAVETMNGLGYIFSGIRHEIGNPVNSLKMTMSVLRNNYDTFTREMVMAYIDRAMGVVIRMEELLRSLKNFNMFEEPRIAAVPLPAFLQSFRALVEQDLQRRGISLVVETDPEAHAAMFDPRALQQVLLNLTSNAADALEGSADRRIILSAEPAQGAVRISVVDHGPGIPHAQQELLFKSFCTTKEAGTGLGLVITRKMLARMKGTIEIESRVGSGTRVVVLLPAAP